MKKEELMDIAVNELEKASYNRQLNMATVRSIANNFDRRIFGHIVVSRRDNKYYIIDGQHRVHAARVRGLRTVPCKVVSGLTERQEADLFVRLNKTRVALRQLDFFDGRCIAGDSKALSMQEIVSKAGFSIGRGDRRLSAIKTVEDVFDKYGEDVLYSALRVIDIAWNGANEARQSSVIRGLAHVLDKHNGAIDIERLGKKLSGHVVAAMLAESRSYTSGKFDPSRFCEIVEHAYNKGVRKENRIRS